MLSRTRLALVLTLAPALAAAAPPPPETALERIDAAGLRSRIAFLSDDALEGRGTGTRGHQLASAYVAAQLEAAGVSPAGDGGTWFQAVPLVRARVEPAPSVALVSRSSRRELKPELFIVAPGPLATTLDVDAEVVFAGYGIEAPRLGRDDYRGLDVRGRVVAVLGNAPDAFPGDERAHHGSIQLKEAVAARHGAVGIVHLMAQGTDAPFWKGLQAVTRRGAVRTVPRAAAGAQAPAALQVNMAASRDATIALLEGSGRTLPELQKSGRPGLRLRSRLQVRGQVVREAFDSRNVVGLLRGRDERLAAETVVFSAHLDHMGERAGEGDTVYNGAVDNASGVAGMIEIAEAFAAAPQRPLRSVMFLAVTGEELGLLGSSWFTAHPTVPAASIVADVNVDMLPIQADLQPLRDVIAFGAEHSSLKQVVERAAAAAGLRVIPDPMPEQRIFVRSDQYSFVRLGVPAVMLFAGGGPEPWLGRLKDWLGSVYHSPEDELQQDVDIQGGVTLAQVSFRIGWEVASEPARPRWNPGDFFGETFGARRAAP